MWNLTRQFTLHLFRSKIFYLTTLFAFVVHFVTLKIIDTVTVQINEAEQFMGPDRVFLVLLFIQMGVGSFVATMYGIWVAPYLHQGDRLPLTFALPVAKWKFPIAYAITFFVLIFLQNTLMFGLHGFIYGYEDYANRAFPLMGLVVCNLYEILVLEVGMFGFALLALGIGKLSALFLGSLVFILCQVAAALFSTDLGAALSEGSPSLKVVGAVYRIMPPWDKVLNQMSAQIQQANLFDAGLLPWCAWLLFLMVGFAVLLLYPRTAKGAE